jgi:hypothetical protein
MFGANKKGIVRLLSQKRVSNGLYLLKMKLGQF